MVAREWLGPSLTVEEAETQYALMGRPFGYLNDEWNALKAEMREGDEIRTFRSSPESWAHLAGRAGIALVRDGAPIRSIVTMMN